jgi:uncharacterized protein
MKSENDFSHAFIDLAKIGRTDWRSVALTVLCVALSFLLVEFLVNLIGAIMVLLQLFFAGRIFHIPDADLTVVFHAADAAACIFGLWLACKKIMRRPFRSLISTDMAFDIRRCFLGAALCLVANAVSLLAFSLFFSIQVGVPLFRRFEWPHHDQIVVSMGVLIVVPFHAFAEELFFRAWLTQTFGHYIRSTITVAMLVAVLFAAAHTTYDLSGKAQIMVDSLGLSVLSLRDRRLELAIGAHSMMNVSVALLALFFTGALPYVQSPVTTLDSWSIVILRGVLPYALLYGLVCITRGWFVPTDARLAIPDDVQPRHLGS